MLILQGHKYHKHYENKNRIIWFCNQKNLTKCRVRIQQDKIENYIEFINRLKHNHAVVTKRRKPGEALALKAKHGVTY